MIRKKVIITGAASGIGRATAIRFANEGYDVCLNDIQTDKLKEVKDELPQGNHLLLPGNYAEKKTILQGEKIINQSWGSVNALINCAGLFEKTNPMEMEIDRWRSTFDCMLNGCLLMTRLAVKFMDKGGRIVHVTSIHGSRSEMHASSYSMAKAAINQYCRSMALELADRNILVNAIAPGFVNTPMSIVEGQSELDSAWFKDNYINNQHLPLRRAGNPDEIAGVAFFLAGKDASYITGQVITVDGGLTITF
ncbi:MAG: SDR family oxidoreductase [Flavobacterium sp.]|nr:SDR family oxidoreductase [Pedobacter sp.]